MHQSIFLRFWFSWHIKGSHLTDHSLSWHKNKNIREMLHHQDFNWFILLVLIISNWIECVSNDLFLISFYRTVFFKSSSKTIESPLKPTINSNVFGLILYSHQNWIRRIYTDSHRYLSMHHRMMDAKIHISNLSFWFVSTRQLLTDTFSNWKVSLIFTGFKFSK